MILHTIQYAKYNLCSVTNWLQEIYKNKMYKEKIYRKDKFTTKGKGHKKRAKKGKNYAMYWYSP